MIDEAVTGFQLFLVGFGIGMGGGCLAGCLPVLAAYVIGQMRDLRSSLADILVLLSGRFVAYGLWGLLAGTSGFYIRRFTTEAFAGYFRLTGSLIIIVLSVFIAAGLDPANKFCGFIKARRYGVKGLFLLGLFIGIAPCAPLVALLFEIAIISKSPWQGFGYAVFFGLGTMLSGFLIMWPTVGLASEFLSRFLKKRKWQVALRLSCAGLLFAFGAYSLIFLT
jgi:hypothetical protein